MNYSVSAANRTARENEMWQQWESQKRPREVVNDEPKSKRKKRKCTGLLLQYATLARKCDHDE